MNKNGFKYECPEKYIYESYVYEDRDFILIIPKELFNNDTIEYIFEIATEYIKNKDEIINKMLDLRLRNWYLKNNYSDEFIKTHIGKPQIKITDKNNNSNYNFNYLGTITFLENELDEHIIEINFKNKLDLSNHITIDG